MKKLLLTLLIVLSLSVPVHALRMVAGVTDEVVTFVAVDATDLHTRETGLSSFTVYYSIGTGSATAMTSPTTAEKDGTNMPGVYTLLIDEGGMTTLPAGDDTVELTLHITHGNIDAVTRVIEIYRPETTAGETLTVGSGIGSADMTEISTSAAAANAQEARLVDATWVTNNLAFFDGTGLSIATVFTDPLSEATLKQGTVPLDTTIAAYTSNTSFTLTAGPPDDTALVGWTIMIVDQSDSTQFAYGVCSAYTTAANTVTLAADPLAAFTFANGDFIYGIVPGRGVDAVATLADTEAWDTADKARTLLTGGTSVISTLGTSDNIGINWADIDGKTTAVDLSATEILRLAELDEDNTTIDLDTTIVSAEAAWDSTTVSSATSTTTFVIADGVIADDVYNGFLITVTDADGDNDPEPAFVKNYISSTKTIILSTALSFTPATSDTVRFLAGFGRGSGVTIFRRKGL